MRLIGEWTAFRCERGPGVKGAMEEPEGPSAVGQPEGASRMPPPIPSWAGPALIVGAVLAVMHGFWLGAKLTNQQVDLLGAWLPWHCHMGKSLIHGDLPTWLPHQFAGAPFASDPQKGWLYLPVMVLYGALGCGRAFGLFVTLQPILAGLGLYWFFRHEGTGRPAATVGGLTLALTISGSAIALSLPFAGVLAWMAMVLAGASGYVHARTKFRMVGWLAFTGLALSQVAAAHLTNGLLLTLVVLGLYLLARLVLQVRGRERGLGAAILVFAVPFLAFPLLAAAVLLPPAALLPRTSIGHGYEDLARLATELSGVVTQPAFTPGVGPWWGTSFARGPHGYVGALGILLIPSAIMSRRWRVPAVAFAAAGFLGWVLYLDGVVRSEAVRSFARKSFLGELWLHSPFRFGFLLVVALALLAGYGFQGWLDARGQPGARSLRDRLSVMALPLVVFVLLPILGGAAPSHYAFFAVGATYGIGLLVSSTRGSTWAAAVLPVLLAVELTSAGLVQQLGPVPEGVRDRLARLPASGLGRSFSSYHTPFIDPPEYLTPGPIGRTLMEAGAKGRYLSFDPETSGTVRGFLTRQGSRHWPAYENGRSVLFGIDEVQGYSPVQIDRYWRLVRRGADRPLYYNAASFQSIDPQVLKLLAVEWLILPAGMPAPGVVLPTPVAAEGGWRLYEVADPHPRASVVFVTQTAPGDGGLDEVLHPAFDPSKEAIVEGPAALPSTSLATGATGTAAYSEVSPQHVRVVVTSSQQGLLVVRNVFDDNWHASVDGRPATVHRVDYLLQGVQVGTGRHVVELTYRDAAIGIGLALSAGAWLILLGMAGWAWHRERRNRAEAASPPDPGGPAPRQG
jgi:hypothetical protein